MGKLQGTMYLDALSGGALIVIAAICGIGLFWFFLAIAMSRLRERWRDRRREKAQLRAWQKEMDGEAVLQPLVTVVYDADFAARDRDINRMYALGYEIRDLGNRVDGSSVVVYHRIRQPLEPIAR